MQQSTLTQKQFNQLITTTANEALTLTFANGSKYEYTRVPRFTFHGLQESASKGKFINNYVINTFKFKRV